jgi:hypothetical protein
LKLRSSPPPAILLSLVTALTELFQREPFLVLRAYESGQDFSLLIDSTLKSIDPEVVVAGIEFWERFINLENVSYKEDFKRRLFD